MVRTTMPRPLVPVGMEGFSLHVCSPASTCSILLHLMVYVCIALKVQMVVTRERPLVFPKLTDWGPAPGALR